SAGFAALLRWLIGQRTISRPTAYTVEDSMTLSAKTAVQTRPCSPNAPTLGSRPRSRRCLSAAPHISPKQLEIVVADFVAPGRHGRRLAVEHGVAEALEVPLRKFAQIKRHPARSNHVAPVAAHAKVVVDLAAKISVIGMRPDRPGHHEHRHDPYAPS